MLFLLLVIQSLLGSGATQGISEYSPQLGTVFADGGEAVLTCKSAVPWYLCIWEGPVKKMSVYSISNMEHDLRTNKCITKFNFMLG